METKKEQLVRVTVIPTDIVLPNIHIADIKQLECHFCGSTTDMHYCVCGQGYITYICKNCIKIFNTMANYKTRS